MTPTILQGMKASLECRVQSAIQSEIMWLKQLEHPSEVGSSQGSGSIIDLGTDKFKILEQQKGTGGLAGGDAPERQTFVQTLISASEEGVEYLNTMIIDAAVPTDAGTYYCFVKNPLGYKFKGAYLNVIPSKQQHFLKPWLSLFMRIDSFTNIKLIQKSSNFLAKSSDIFEFQKDLNG